MVDWYSDSSGLVEGADSGGEAATPREIGGFQTGGAISEPPNRLEAASSVTPEPPVGIEVDPAPRSAEEQEEEAAEREFAARRAMRPAQHGVSKWQPFPVDELPEPCRRYVKAAARAIGCDEAYIVLPLLSALAAAVGNSRSIRLSDNWDEPAVIWSAVVGQGGTLKSPALEITLQSLWQWHEEELQEYEQALEEHPRKWEAYSKELAAWKRQHEGLGSLLDDEQADRLASEPREPVRPVCRRTIVSDVSIQSLQVILSENPRGVLMVQDELAGWLASFDSRRGGKGCHAARWLTTFNARAWLVDRGGVNRRIIYIPRAAVSVTGGIQPEVLRRALARGQAQEGFGARLLMAYPPRDHRAWKLRGLPREISEQLAGLFRKLRELEPDRNAAGKPIPRVLPLARRAQVVWLVFYRDWAFRAFGVSSDVIGAYAKMECYMARLALIVHLVRAATGETSPEEVDRESMAAAEVMAYWFAEEAIRINALFSGQSNPDDPGPLIDWIRKKGGRVTVSKLMRGPRAFRTSEAAEGALAALVRNDYGAWVTTKTGGRENWEFVLHARFAEEAGE